MIRYIHTLLAWVRSFFSLFMMIMLFACESVIPIELGEAEKMIVVNGTLSHDSLVKIQVSRTRHILDNAPLTILESAEAGVYQDGTLSAELGYSDNGFFSHPSFKPRMGNEYEIRVGHPGFPSASARTVLPERVEILGVDTITVEEESEYEDPYYPEDDPFLFGNRKFRFDLTLQDPAGHENFYLVNVKTVRGITEWTDTTVTLIDSVYHSGKWNYFTKDSSYMKGKVSRVTEYPYIESDDIIVETVVNEGMVFSDQAIDGKTYSVRGEIYEYDLQSADSTVISVMLHSISEGYFRYLKTREKHYQARENPFAVPVIVYSNIIGGTGYLGGSSTDIITIIY